MDGLQGTVPQRVVRALAEVDRRCFVPDELAGEAWSDVALPLGNGQTISQPSLVATMVALADPPAAARVLDVGTGSGYHAAVLAQMGAHVFSIERDADLSACAAMALRRAAVAGVRLHVGDGTGGLPHAAPFAAISVAAAVAEPLPRALTEQLADGGRLVVPVGGPEEQELLCVTRVGEELHRSHHGRVRFVPFVVGRQWAG